MKPTRAPVHHLLTPGGVRNVDAELLRIFALCRAGEPRSSRKKGYQTPEEIALQTAAAHLLIARYLKETR